MFTFCCWLYVVNEIWRERQMLVKIIVHLTSDTVFMSTTCQLLYTVNPLVLDVLIVLTGGLDRVAL